MSSPVVSLGFVLGVLFVLMKSERGYRVPSLALACRLSCLFDYYGCIVKDPRRRSGSFLSLMILVFMPVFSIMLPDVMDFLPVM